MVALTWLGQAGFLVEAGAHRLLFDPFLTDSPDRLVAAPLAVEVLPELAAVLVSHGHGDHLDPEFLGQLAQRQPDVPIVVPESLGDDLPARSLLTCRPGDDLAPGGVPVHVVAACHGVEPADAYRFGPFHGYIVELDGVRLYHAGDTLAWDGLAAVLLEQRVDVALLPINGRDPEREAAGIVGNMDHREAVQLAAAAGARVLVPMHYGMFASNTVDPELVDREVAAQGATLEVRRPVLGEPIEV